MELGGLKARKPKATKRGRARVLVFGKRKNGKSMGLCTFKNALYIDTEGGALEPQYQKRLEESGSLYVGPEEGSQDHEKIISAMKAMCNTKHGIKWIIYDSLSKLFDTQVAVDLDRMTDKAIKQNKELESTFGAEKKGAIRFVRRLVRWADLLDVNLVLVCHSKDQWSDGKVVGTTFDGWDKLGYELHLLLEVNNRSAAVIDTRYEEFQKGTSFDWNYGEFIKRYGADAIESAPVQVAIATAEQVEQLNHLLSVRNDADALTAKWLKAASAEDFADMKADDVAKCIAYLSKPQTGKAA